MRIQANNSFKPTAEAETRFNKVIGQYDDYINKLINDNRTWRIIALMSLLIVIISMIGWFAALNMKKESLLVVEVNELGRAKYMGELRGKGPYDRGMVKDYMVEALIRDWIEYTRSIHLDYEIMNENYMKAMYWCSGAMQMKLRDELLAEDPNSQIGRVKKKVSVESVLRLGESSWQFDWFDLTYTMDGQELNRMRQRGVFTVIKQEPKEGERDYNPLGVYIIDYDITRVNEVLR